MTKSTDSKNITKIVQVILSSNGIDNLKLEIDLVTAWKRYLFEREEGETPAGARERVVQDYVGAVLAVARAGMDRVQYQKRIETVLGLSPNWDDLKQDWNSFDTWLMSKEKEGQTIEAFMKWYNSDEFRAKGRIYLNPPKIKLIWNNAFEHKKEESRPAEPLPDYTPNPRPANVPPPRIPKRTI
jgi:hypothetical protein